METASQELEILYTDDDLKFRLAKVPELPDFLMEQCTDFAIGMIGQIAKSMKTGKLQQDLAEKEGACRLFDHIAGTFLAGWSASNKRDKELYEKMNSRVEIQEVTEDSTSEGGGEQEDEVISQCINNDVPETWKARTTCYVNSVVQATETLADCDSQTDVLVKEDVSLQVEIKPETQDRYTTRRFFLRKTLLPVWSPEVVRKKKKVRSIDQDNQIHSEGAPARQVSVCEGTSSEGRYQCGEDGNLQEKLMEFSLKRKVKPMGKFSASS